MIRIRGLRRKLGSKQVLDGVDLDVENGECIVIMGRSGSGKSVLLKHVLGLMTADAGSIEVDGEEVVGTSERDMNEIRKRFGFLFQGAALFDSMTVGENVGLALHEQLHLGRDEIRRRVAERLELVGLTGVEGMKPASLSGGMRKRVGLARAIAMDPQYILYDEPTTGLDPILADSIHQLIRSLQGRLGITSIVVTHDMSGAYKIANRMAMLDGGRIVFTGTPEEVKHTGDPLVRQFVEGSSEGPVHAV